MDYVTTASAPVPMIQFRSELPNCLRRLTKRQREVFWLLSYGECNKAIARRMSVSEATIRHTCRQSFLGWVAPTARKLH